MSTIEAISTERALKLALEAIENMSTALREDDVIGNDIDMILDAITTLQKELTSVPDWASEAIEQPSGGATLAPVAKPNEQEPESECNPQDLCAGCRCKYAEQPAPVQQEPVAEVKLKQQGGNAGLATVIHEIFDPVREPLRVGDKLYTSPPANANAGKPWEGLTDEDILAANYPDGEENGPTISAPDFELDCFAKQVEAKLKEKNNGN